MHKAIETYLAELLPKLAQYGVHLIEQRDISYGTQLILSGGIESVKLNVYFSAKNGISKVINKGGGANITAILAEILNIDQSPLPTEELHQWESWIGSDECGKGDYFGALVVACFHLKKSEIPILRKLGVCDSKKLKDDKTREIALKLYELFPGRSNCIVLKPVKYNELYANMKQQNKNLNDLLAWQHCAVVGELYQKHQDVQGALIDQFSLSHKAEKMLKAKYPALKVIERTKAEADPAVAAASIIARYQFIKTQAELSEYYSMKLPLGAGRHTVQAARDFVAKYHRNRLNEVVKLHFVSTQQI